CTRTRPFWSAGRTRGRAGVACRRYAKVERVLGWRPPTSIDSGLERLLSGPSPAPVVLMIFSVPVGWTVLFIVPALVILTINGIWVSMLLGMVSARYRDVPPIVMNFVQVIFFLTPIFWPPEALGIWMQALPLNPLFAARRCACSAPRRNATHVFLDGA